MANEYYTYDGVTPGDHTKGLSSAIRSIASGISVGLDKLPVMAGNGDKLVQINSAGTAMTSVSITSLSFSATLPAQTGNAGKVITTDGTTASWASVLSKSQNATTDFAVSNTDAGGAAYASWTATTNAGSVILKSGSTASAFGASLLWGGTAGPMTWGTTGAADVKVTVANTVRTTYSNATGAQTHTVTPSAAGAVNTVTASHNSNQYASIENTNAGASAVAGLRAVSNAGSVRLEAASTALGGYGSSTFVGSGKYVAGTQSGGGDAEIWTDGVARVVVSDASVNLTAGPGSMFIGGQRTISIVVIGNNVTGPSIYSPMAHGHTRAPDLMFPKAIMNGATQGYAQGDTALFSGGSSAVGVRANDTNVWLLQQATPAIFHASTAVPTTVSAGNLSMRVTCIWL